MGNEQKAFFEIGEPLDALVIMDNHPLIQTCSQKNRTNTLVYAADSSMNLGTIINGQWIIKEGSHLNEDIHSNFIKTMNNLKVR